MYMYVCMYVCVYKRELKKTRKPDDSDLRSYPKDIRKLLPAMEDENTGPFRRTSSRTRKVASKMVAALTSADNRTQAVLARLEALESDNAGAEVVEANDDEDASLDEDDQVYIQKKLSKSTKRKTRQAIALENAKKAPRTFMELIHDSNLESLPPHVPTYLRAAVGPPGSSSRRHFCTVCGFTANYTCVRCGMRFCSCRCQNIHNDTRCLKFVA
ncbi:putative Zinc finger, HIT-type [Dioscorea sansibarensis]